MSIGSIGLNYTRVEEASLCASGAYRDPAGAPAKGMGSATIDEVRHILDRELSASGEVGDAAAGVEDARRACACSCGCRLVAAAAPWEMLCVSCDALWQVDREADRRDVDWDAIARCGLPRSDLFPSSCLSDAMAPGRSRADDRDRALMRRLYALRDRASAARVAPAIVRVAERIFKMADEHPAMRGRSRASLAEGALYLAARACDSPRSPADVAAALDSTESDVARAARRITDLLGASIAPRNVSPAAFLAKFRRSEGACEVPPEVWDVANALSSSSAKTGPSAPSDVKPHVRAAAFLAVACARRGVRGGARIASELAGVSQTSVRRAASDVRPVPFESADPSAP